jgi:hypothetical protein
MPNKGSRMQGSVTLHQPLFTAQYRNPTLGKLSRSRPADTPVLLWSRYIHPPGTTSSTTPSVIIKLLHSTDNMSSIASAVTKTVTKTAASTAASATSTLRAKPQGGVLEGSNPTVWDSSNPIILFIIQVRTHPADWRRDLQNVAQLQPGLRRLSCLVFDRAVSRVHHYWKLVIVTAVSR